MAPAWRPAVCIWGVIPDFFTEKSSKTPAFWTAFDAPPSKNEEKEEEAAELDGVPSDVEHVDEGTELYSHKEVRFEKFRGKLTNKEVKVNATPQLSCIRHFAS